MGKLLDQIFRCIDQVSLGLRLLVKMYYKKIYNPKVMNKTMKYDVCRNEMKIWKAVDVVIPLIFFFSIFQLPVQQKYLNLQQGKDLYLESAGIF